LDDMIERIGRLDLEENETPLVKKPRASQKNKKDLAHIQCFRCQKYSHYAKQFCDSKKRRHQASTLMLINMLHIRIQGTVIEHNSFLYSLSRVQFLLLDTLG